MTNSPERTPRQEFPSPEKLRVYGDLTFLAMRSPHHRGMTVAQLHRALEPAIELGHYRIWRWDEVPRAAITWAWLSAETERKFVTENTLDPNDWRSGKRLWIVDMMAPYPGLTAQIARWLMVPGNFAEQSFTFRRIKAGDQTRRIVEVDFKRASKARILTDADFR